jgi:hypothetical protein
MTTSDEVIDNAILSIVGSRFQKVAMIIAKAEKELERRSLIVDMEMIWKRIIALTGDGKLEGAGDLARWRHSEVRLPPNAQ